MGHSRNPAKLLGFKIICEKFVYLAEYFLANWTGRATLWIRSRKPRDPRTLFTKQVIILPLSQAAITQFNV